jgi:poly-gamma-glutamate synthesis protein (capsule biosynthesis protein)
MSAILSRFGRRQVLGFPLAAAMTQFSASNCAGRVSADPKSDDDKSLADADLVTLFVCGDVMTGRAIDQVLPQPGNPRICERYATSAEAYVDLAEKAHGPIARPVSFAYTWGDALPELRTRMPDLRIINLETSVTTSEACTNRGISYRMSPDNIPCLTAAGVDCCVLANNHVLDWGRAGLLETLDTLESAKIKTAGAGRDIAEAAAPAILTIPGKGRVLVFAFGMPTSGIPGDWAASPGRSGVNFLNDLSPAVIKLLAERIGALRQPRDIVVVSIHWGPNWGYEIPKRQVDFAHGLIDEAGVDVIHGHSSHHAKAIEVYRDRPILYGCGDFLNDYEGITGYEGFRDDLAAMYFLTIEASRGKLAGLTIVPFQIRNFRLNRASPADATWLSNILAREGVSFGTGIRLNSDKTMDVIWR